MSTTDHLANAREYIAQGDEFYAKAAGEIAAAMDERPELTWAQIGRDLGRDESWVRRLVTSFRNPARATDGPFEVDWQSGSNKRDEVATKVLSDPEQRKQVIAALPSEQIEELIGEANEVAIERVRATRAEHDTAPREPTAGELMGGDKFDPSESWADTLIVRVNRNARELAHHIAKWGVVIASLGEDTAFEYLQEAERNIAEVRVALQERIRDHAEV